LSAILTHHLPDRIPPRTLDGGIAVVFDILRASTTMVHALGAGAAYLRPFAEPGEALGARDREPAGSVVLGGERGGVRIPAFDLGNSPGEYAPESVGGRAVFFTTTNGTRALLASLSAERVLVGSFNNLSAVVQEVVRDPRPVHLVCAGTRGEVSLEDTLCAGAIASSMCDRGAFECNDAARLAMSAWKSAGPLPEALRSGSGGRDVLALGLERDIDVAAAVDSCSLVPELDKATMRLM
jgi:2-phosphosulfolactate phosphatase